MPQRHFQHLFSVDLEEHFHAHVFEHVVPRERWTAQPSRVEASTERLLALLERHRVRATFFVLGWVAQRCPTLVARVAALGHEIASHSWWHPRISDLTPEQFREEVRSSKAILEEQGGRAVLGFRAPSFSIRPGMEWAFDVLLEEGYRYDSSLFPIRHPRYGYPSAPPYPHRLDRAKGMLHELPMTTLQVGAFRIPAAGGAYLRHFPLAVIRGGFRQAQSRGRPGMLYVHPWEVDEGQPRLPVSALNRLRHYGGIGRTLPRLDRLLREFRFGPVEDWLREGA
jgi:polysaccharide deacetylase family protein (PEP-CTERM system associated)